MIRLARISLLLMATATVALFGQSFSIGVEGGVRATDDFQYAATSESGVTLWGRPRK